MKTKFIALILSVCLLLTGCITVEISLPGGDNTKPSDTQATASSIPTIYDYPDAIGTNEEKILTPLLPNEIFSSTAETNGLAGTLYQIYGTVEKISADDDGVADTIHLRTHKGNVVISNLTLSMEANPSLGELGSIDWDMVKSLFPMPKIGEFCCIFAEYQGFSEKHQAPYFMYGSSDYLSEVLVSALKTS